MTSQVLQDNVNDLLNEVNETPSEEKVFRLQQLAPRVTLLFEELNKQLKKTTNVACLEETSSQLTIVWIHYGSIEFYNIGYNISNDYKLYLTDYLIYDNLVKYYISA